MSHDFAKKKKARTSGQSRGLPPWFWMLAGIIIGLFIAFLLYLGNLQFEPSDIDTSKQQDELSKQIKEQAERLREGKEILKKPTFEFYQRLPEIKMETPKVERKPVSVDGKKSYILQAGSFRSFQDADALKASLIMQGLDVQISTVSDSQGKDWHRVQVGPYQSERQLSKAQDVLANNNIPSIRMEVK